MNLWHDVSVGKDAPETFTTIIEIPRGSLNKYEIDKETGLIALDRVMHTAQVYPIDYGFAPQTLWDDGDALDVAILATEPLFPGIVVHSRPVGIMTMIDDGESDDKVIAVPVDDPRWKDVKDISDVNEHTLKTIKHFFETYKGLQDKVVTIEGFKGKAEAIEAVKRSIDMYNEKHAK
jgi:inorganic pyrophosphatase